MLETAARLFARKGFSGTTPQDIADEMGMSRPALYYYFKKKEDILASMIEEVTVFSGQRSTKALEIEGARASDVLRELVRSHALWLLDHLIEFKMVDRSEADFPPELQALNERAKRQVLDSFTRIIERGIKFGDFRPVDARVAAFTIIGMCSWTAWWFRPEGRVSKEEVAATISDMAVASIRSTAEKGDGPLNLKDAIRIIRDDVSRLEAIADGASKGAAQARKPARARRPRA